MSMNGAERSSAAPILYAASAAPLADPARYAAAWAAASPERREKTQRLRFAKDRRLSLAAELLLRHALREAGIEELPALTADPGGKPRLPGGELCFNLAHSGEWAVCAVAGFEVGCDLEQLRPVDLRLPRRFFRENEAEFIAAAPDPEVQQERFFRLWTRKESVLKATGLGLRLPLDAFEILSDAPVLPQDERAWQLRSFGQIPGYACALCGAGDCSAAVLRILDLTELQ